MHTCIHRVHCWIWAARLIAAAWTHRPVWEECHEGGCQPSIEPFAALSFYDAAQSTCTKTHAMVGLLQQAQAEERRLHHHRAPMMPRVLPTFWTCICVLRTSSGHTNVAVRAPAHITHGGYGSNAIGEPQQQGIYPFNNQDDDSPHGGGVVSTKGNEPASAPESALIT